MVCTNKVIDNIPLTHIGSSEAIDVDPERNLIYVVSKSSDSITVINGKTNKIVTNFKN